MGKTKLKQRLKRDVPASPPGQSSTKKKQKTQKSINRLKTEVEIETLSFDDAFSAGLAFEQLKSLDGASAAFQRAVECDPNHLEALVHLADVHSAAGRTNAALKCYKQASKLNDGQEDASVWFRLGLNHAAMLQHIKAIKAYKRSLQLLEKQSEAIGNLDDKDVMKPYGVTLAALAEAFGELADLESAVKVYENAVAKFPDNANMRYNLANMLLARRESIGDHAFDSEVVECLERAIQLGPKTLEFVSVLAEYLEGHGQHPDRVHELKLVAKELASCDESKTEQEDKREGDESDG